MLMVTFRWRHGGDEDGWGSGKGTGKGTEKAAWFRNQTASGPAQLSPARTGARNRGASGISR